MPLLSEIEFGAFLQYAVRALDPELRAKSLRLRDAIKRGHDPLFDLLAKNLAKRLAPDTAVCDLFGSDVVLVPLPGSAVTKPNTLWVPKRIAEALGRAGLCARVETWLSRVTAVPKSAFARPQDRPSAQRHYDTIAATRVLDAPARIVVVDDVVTSGATMLAAVSRIAEAFPESTVRGFAVTRAISDGDVTQAHAPVRGHIRLRRDGRTWRDP